MSTILWILTGVLLGVLYLTTLIVLGLATLSKGHTVLFWFGILFPFLWIVGAIMGPTPRTSAAEARNRLRTASYVSMGRPKPGQAGEWVTPGPRGQGDPPRTAQEFRARRLGIELRARTAEVAEERRQVARLRREVAELNALQESSQPTHRGDLASNA